MFLSCIVFSTVLAKSQQIKLAYQFLYSSVSKEKSNSSPPIVIYVPVNQQFNINGCTVTIDMGIYYVFNELTLELVAVYTTPVYITINCGIPHNYVRSSNEVSIEVNNDEVTDVYFENSGTQELDDILNDTGFQQKFVTMVNNNRPRL